ncbi:hypothetical protein HOY80DRAFT_939164 [Tuber brumale]|nr:hypothetical protein HOY80DRAFT_939164 [Tuber brumale]
MRRFAIMGDLISALGKLAGSRGVAVLLLSQMTTKVIPGVGAILTPSLCSPAWITSLNSRLLIHYNKTSPSLLADPDDTLVSQIRYVTILKSNGVLNSSGSVTLLKIQETGVDDVKLVSESSPVAPAMKPYGPTRKKRKRGLEAETIPGSDEEVDGESEENEDEGSAGDLYRWQEVTNGDG